jgi:hypothetical protein
MAQPTRRLVWDFIDPNLNITSTIPDPLDSATNPAAKRSLPDWWPSNHHNNTRTSYDSIPIVGTLLEVTNFGRNGEHAQSVCERSRPTSEKC